MSNSPVASKKLTQSVVDTATVYEFGPVSFVHIDFGGQRTEKSSNILIASAAVKRATKYEFSIDAMLRHEEYVVLSEEGRALLERYGAWAVTTKGRNLGDAELVASEELFYAAENPLCLERLAKLRDEDINRYVGRFVNEFFYDVSGNALNTPIALELSARYLNIDAAQRVLNAHPQVVRCVYDNGRPGSYDHVPASLRVWVKCSDEQFAALMNLPTRAGWEASVVGTLEGAVYAESDIEALRDFLGLSAFRHDSYIDPTD